MEISINRSQTLAVEVKAEIDGTKFMGRDQIYLDAMKLCGLKRLEFDLTASATFIRPQSSDNRLPTTAIVTQARLCCASGKHQSSEHNGHSER
jgi:hypothetical protein